MALEIVEAYWRTNLPAHITVREVGTVRDHIALCGEDVSEWGRRPLASQWSQRLCVACGKVMDERS